MNLHEAAQLYATAVDIEGPVARQKAINQILGSSGFSEGELATELFYPGSEVTPDFYKPAN